MTNEPARGITTAGSNRTSFAPDQPSAPEIALFAVDLELLGAAIASIDDAIADAPAPDYEESNYDAGFVAGLAAARALLAGPDAEPGPEPEPEEVPHRLWPVLPKPVRREYTTQGEDVRAYMTEHSVTRVVATPIVRESRIAEEKEYAAAWVQYQVSLAPPFTEKQVRRLNLIFSGGASGSFSE